MEKTAELHKALSQNDSREYFKARKVRTCTQRHIASDGRIFKQDYV